ncbi:MAG: hypothetical protein ABFS38_19640 [Bacteroidota bacterium]
MKEHENLYEKIQEILGGTPSNLKILEHQIDMDLQVEYYEYSRKLKNELDESWAFDHMRYLPEPGYSHDVKKEILARLASIENVQCYRAIESYVDMAEEPLKDWALLALNESRMQLESKIMEENQVFISTGLGGKKQKLRYFVVLMSRTKTDLTPTHQMVIHNEFEFILKKFDAEVEEVNFSGYLATILLLLPMNYSLKMVFQEAINECNQYGNFLEEDYIVTNVKTFSFKEIKEFLKRKSDNN